MKNKIYTRDFKERAVLLSFERGNIEQVERELEITHSLLNRWRQDYLKYGSGSFPGTGFLKCSRDQKRIHELEKNIKKVDLNFEILKNAALHLYQGKQMVFQFISDNEKNYAIKQMCKVLSVKQRTYHRWKNQFISESEKKKILIKDEINIVFFNAKKRYGAARIAIELQKRGIKISSSTVGRYMRALGLYCEIKKN